MARKRKNPPGPYLLHLELIRERVYDPSRFPYTLPAIRGLTTLPFHEKVTFFVGENGSGKSTLLEAIAIELDLNPEGGSVNFNFATRESHSALHKAIRIARHPGGTSERFFLRAESFYNVATKIEELDKHRVEGVPYRPIIKHFGGLSLHEQSHGESFFALFRNRFGANGLYLMDEPEAALSPNRQLEFLAMLHDYCERGCQFIIATHSPIIMAYPDALIYQFDRKDLRVVAYEDTEHYQITRGFLMNRKRNLDIIMGKED